MHVEMRVLALPNFTVVLLFLVRVLHLRLCWLDLRVFSISLSLSLSLCLCLSLSSSLLHCGDFIFDIGGAVFAEGGYARVSYCTTRRNRAGATYEACWRLSLVMYDGNMAMESFVELDTGKYGRNCVRAMLAVVVAVVVAEKVVRKVRAG
jgi:hypothetical protein